MAKMNSDAIALRTFHNSPSWVGIILSDIGYCNIKPTYADRGMAYRIEYSPESETHLQYLTARQQAIVLDTVDEQLMYQPTVETKNRKLMRPNPLAPWELRIGNLRVYYDIEEEPDAVVYINAVGIKERNQVRIAGEIYDL
ncbi:type II toxin-antitoxin system RelE family toxin [Coleofasciculus sp. F4-SAH-05]|uniref:type II toxin-antitoxin system RelE family toxin n=1 Tax=Coleofasciculus sp. F4-SAH-05 TaxID=3069525 RepID=UPI0033016B21